jgi:hypothetical protein
LLLGAGALLALVILALVLVWALRRQSGDELLELADRDYRAGAKEYDDYLDKFPNHESASAARVRRGLAELRQSAETARDWNPTLDVANEVLARIAIEDDFSSSHSELAGLLPNIAEGLSKQAAAAPSQQLIDRSNEALALVDKYVPAEIQPGQQLTEIRSSVAVTVRNLARNGALAKVMADLSTLAASGEPEKAYAARSDLLARYPELVDEGRGHARDHRGRAESGATGRRPARGRKNSRRDSDSCRDCAGAG